MTARRSRPSSAACSCDPQLLGRIEGTQTMILEHLKTQGQDLKAMDARLRTQENKGAIAGAVGGALMALGVSLASFWIKGKS